uniref:Variant erythrocyte surface antigen-1 n=1 Tax=Babesia orientalis TaxID=273649 RepID=A0A8F9WJT2_9APIC|nr:variant erythrocyte surface antigen-1 [Babesia orientalis]
MSCQTVIENNKTNPMGANKMKYPSITAHLTHLGQGQQCSIPMGFRGCFKMKHSTDSSRTGSHIFSVIVYYCSLTIKQSCLYHMVRCINALAHRVPETVGSMWGFYYYFAKLYDNKCGLDTAFDGVNEKWCIDCECKTIAGDLKSWRGDGDHSKHTTTGGSKNAIGVMETMQVGYQATNCLSDGQNCGRYLFPLDGSIYETLSTDYCLTYLTWLIHMTLVFKERLERLMNEFNDISCEDMGCGSTAGQGGP